ncbi:MAG: hypothetical protein ABFS39_20020 [Pseudomonadota bacterium]
MHRLSENLLVILLTLLLGFSPLQGAIAGVASSDQEGGTHQMADMHASMAIASDHATAHDCEQCNTDECCTGHSCSSGQCASSVLVVLTVFSYHIDVDAMPGMFLPDTSFTSQSASSLYRPPRA